MLIYDLDHPPALLHLRSTLAQLGIAATERRLAMHAPGRFLTLMIRSGSTELSPRRFSNTDALLAGIKEAQIAATAAGFGDIDIQHNVSPDVRPLIAALCVGATGATPTGGSVTQ